MEPSKLPFWAPLLITLLLGAATASVVVPPLGLVGYLIMLWLIFVIARSLLRGVGK